MLAGLKTLWEAHGVCVAQVQVSSGRNLALQLPWEHEAVLDTGLGAAPVLGRGKGEAKYSPLRERTGSLEGL